MSKSLQLLKWIKPSDLKCLSPVLYRWARKTLRFWWKFDSIFIHSHKFNKQKSWTGIEPRAFGLQIRRSATEPPRLCEGRVIINKISTFTNAKKPSLSAFPGRVSGRSLACPRGDTVHTRYTAPTRCVGWLTHVYSEWLCHASVTVFN